MEKFNDLLPIALDWKAQGKNVAIATVTKTWGSAPRPAGSQLVINEEKEFFGSVSGGCVEGAVIEEAVRCLETGQSLLLKYEVSDQDAFAVNLTCGGKIEILIQVIGEKFSFDLLKTLIAKVITLAKLVFVKDWEVKLSWITFITVICMWVWIHMQI